MSPTPAVHRPLVLQTLSLLQLLLLQLHPSPLLPQHLLGCQTHQHAGQLSSATSRQDSQYSCLLYSLTLTEICGHHCNLCSHDCDRD